MWKATKRTQNIKRYMRFSCIGSNFFTSWLLVLKSYRKKSLKPIVKKVFLKYPWKSCSNSISRLSTNSNFSATPCITADWTITRNWLLRSSQFVSGCPEIFISARLCGEALKLQKSNVNNQRGFSANVSLSRFRYFNQRNIRKHSGVFWKTVLCKSRQDPWKAFMKKLRLERCLLAR